MKTIVTTALLMGLLFLGLTGCVSKPQTQMRTAFSLKDFEPYKANGLGKIYGQAFLKTRGGDVKVGAGDKIVLWPFPPFMKEVISLKDQGHSITNYTQEMVQQMLPYVRESIGDAQGNYEFTGLPPGDYFLEVTIKWLAGNQTTGGVIRKPVTLGEGQVMKVVLTP